ncbi:MAG: efflux RND transporter permease subunit [Myxococcota bacterium]
MSEVEESSHEPDGISRKGPLGWMTIHPTAGNIVMAILIFGGLVMLGLLGSSKIKQEVFPEFELDLVLIHVAYPGASPEEVEQGVSLAVEEAVRGLDGVKEVRTTSSEGIAVIAVELLLGTDSDRALSDIKAAVDRVTSFPEDVERPVVSLATNRFRVISLVVHGDKSERELRNLAEQMRDDLLARDDITYVELSGVRPYEISIEIPQETLRRYGLTIDQVATRIRQASVELPGGGIKTRAGEVLVRTSERRLVGSEFEDIVILSRPDGSEVRVSDLGEVRDGFQEDDLETFFNGERAATVDVFRVADETPLTVAAGTRDYIAEVEDSLPAGISLTTWNDQSEIYQQRVELLLKNAWIGLVLVMFILGLFLEIRLAFWVTLGIPISFIGAMLFLPTLDVSINMISLFAFIVTLGMVVDDAIVVGEAVYKHRSDGMGVVSAAIAGVREVAVPVVFSILTSCIFFAPMLFVPGAPGKFFRVIPLIVITVLLISLVESLLILPAHLAHKSKFLSLVTKILFLHRLHRLIAPAQQRFSRLVESMIQRFYVPWLRICVRNRYLTLAVCVSVFIASLGAIAGDRLQFTFLPKIEGDVIAADVVMPFGTSVEDTRSAVQRMETALRDELGDELILTSRGLQATVGSASTSGGPRGAQVSTGSHLGQVLLYMVPVDQRSFTASELADRWRARIGEIAGAESLQFTYSTGPSSGSPISIQLSHPDLETLQVAGEDLAASLGGFTGVIDIGDGFEEGKEQFDFRLTPEGRALGLTELELARQVRSAFFGAEAVRQQRGRDEVRVFVRRPLRERDSLVTLEQFLIRTPDGGEVPLGQAATVSRGRSYTSIRRVDGRSVITVTADVAEGTNANQVTRRLDAEVLPALTASFDGLTYRPSGSQQEQAETLGSLAAGMGLALVVMFGLLAIVFRSYLHPFVVMSAIPFGFVGAVLGHLGMGYDMSLMSAMGFIALSGVVVNDSLILVVAANDYRKTSGIQEGVIQAGARRFRPIILTSLTTFFGLTPMILETSTQARFLVPMAISLGFGILFATFIILLLVPSLYVIFEDLKRITGLIVEFIWGDEPAEQVLEKLFPKSPPEPSPLPPRSSGPALGPIPSATQRSSTE